MINITRSISASSQKKRQRKANVKRLMWVKIFAPAVDDKRVYVIKHSHEHSGKGMYLSNEKLIPINESLQHAIDPGILDD
jgi:hypothetical protein